MSELYNAEYYHSDCGPVPYEEPERWEEFFGAVADRIVADLAPRTVLDAGCAMGYLVAALRDRGVEAYGVDISEYAISKVREDVKPYCAVGSLTEPLPEGLPRRYDLVVTIEVLEHLRAEDGKQAIANLCTLSDRLLFSSTPDDFTERTHVNVQQREYWARLFAENGFLDDLSYRPTYLTYYAACYRKSGDWLRQVEDYERNLRNGEAERKRQEAACSKAVEDKEVHIQNLNGIQAAREAEWTARARTQAALEETLRQQQAESERRLARQGEELERRSKELALSQWLVTEQADRLLEDQRIMEEQRERLATLEERYETVAGKLAHFEKHYYAAIHQRDELQRQLDQARHQYDVISNAFFWKLTKPLRTLVDWVKKPFRSSPKAQLVWKGMRCLKQNGVGYTWKKVKEKLSHRKDFSKAVMSPFTPEELEEQKKDVFPRDITISILVPLYNTPETFLREMIRSVLDQTYGKWELCLADGSDKDHSRVGDICRRYAKQDKRIRYRKLERNLGISNNTNACIEMSTGEYIALFDHDDLLHPAALHEVMRAICEQDADFIYTDEATFESPDINKITVIHLKPDFAIDNLRANNYICHLSVFSRTILDRVEGFRSEYDGSQDHDFILRATECARKIVHIPEVLYLWRAHPASVAQTIGSKSYAVDAGIRAVGDHIARCGMEATVESSKALGSIYRIRYAIQGRPKVSILIPNRDHGKDLRRCVESILSLSTYPNFEIVIVDNGSVDPEVLAYYDHLRRETRREIRILEWDHPFNYSAINNYGAKEVSGDYILLLNNDTEVIAPEWIEEMLMYAQRKDVGAVGAKLYYYDDTIQHGGVGIGLLTLAGHLHRGFDRRHPGYMGRLSYAQDLSAVTAACVMIRRDVWEEVGGLDESFQVAFNDIDLCMRIRKAGYLIVWTPYAELYHYESKSRGLEDTPEKRARFVGEVTRFQQRWAKELAAGDPYYNPNFRLDREDFSIR